MTKTIFQLVIRPDVNDFGDAISVRMFPCCTLVTCVVITTNNARFKKKGSKVARWPTQFDVNTERTFGVRFPAVFTGAAETFTSVYK
jgi:hypothetical protein